ncbi:Pentatricopeptide repeat-containing protein [Escovopsis weberi]|uniref:Pentatricopeptide repeat-containing protein n=1 Tax=Escovopsis weberi TaxID=150374 RepID=A0A0N0RTL6_ESCWE|nr:Pentatricopeptide repeat-containing protein [Escovopsis weberi]
MAGRHSGPYLWRDKGRWLFELDDISAMRRAWGGLTTEERQRDWPLVMLSTLFSRPARAEMVLEATLDPLPPGYAVLDVLTFVARRLLLEDIKEFRQRRLKAEQTFDLLARILEHMPPGHMPLWQRMLGLFARKLPRDLASELYVVAQRLGLPLHPNTLLQFASRLAGHMAHKQQAFEILQGLAERGVDLNGPVPQSAITSLLHCRPDHEGWTDETAAAFSPRRVLESLMERGFSPNHINATAFLDSLCQRADVDEAIRLALLFAESGVQLDAKAWATIFRGAKHSLRADVVARGFDVAKAASAPYVDVLNNALHAVYYFADAESREAPGARAPWVLPLFEPMLYLYAQRFELGPLQQWLPDSLPLVITQPEGFEEKFEGGGRRRAWRFLQTVVPAVNRFFYAHKAARRLQPSTTTLALMLRAYVRTLRQPYDLMAFYAFFKARLEEPGAPGARLIRDQGSLIHDTIIMTMTERRGLSRPALQVFGDMLRQQQQQQQQRSASSSPSSAPSPHPAPSLCTFSILVRGLIARGDRLLAEQVIQVMREQGIEPDLVAWNTLVKGYAVMQDMGKTVQALQDMEAAGFRPDLFTFRAFGRLKDQGRALEMMEAIIRHNSQTMAADDWSS